MHISTHMPSSSQVGRCEVLKGRCTMSGWWRGRRVCRGVCSKCMWVLLCTQVYVAVVLSVFAFAGVFSCAIKPDAGGEFVFSNKATRA